MTEINKKSLAFTIEMNQDGKLWTLYIPAPSKNRVLAATPVLGYIFSLRQNTTLVPSVIAKDYETYALEACRALSVVSAEGEQAIEERSQKMLAGFKGFVEDSVMSGNAIGPDLKSMSIMEAKTSGKLSEDIIDYAIGLYVFFYCIWRYASHTLGEKEKKALTTSLTLMEYITSLQTSLSEKETSSPKATA